MSKQIALAAPDVPGMVRDRRSSRNGKAGAPEHLPVPPAAALRVSEDDRAFLAAAYAAVEATAAALATAQQEATQALHGRAFAVKHLFRKYGLGDRDGIDYATGEIKRGGFGMGEIQAAGPPTPA